MNDYLHNLIQCLAITHCVAFGCVAFVNLMAFMEFRKMPSRFMRIAILLAAPLPFTAAWLATYGGIQ